MFKRKCIQKGKKINDKKAAQGVSINMSLRGGKDI